MVPPVEYAGTVGCRHPEIGRFHLVVVQEVLLFGSETWLMYPFNRRILDIFQQRVIHQLMVWQPIRKAYRSWSYPPLATVMSDSGLE